MTKNWFSLNFPSLLSIYWLRLFFTKKRNISSENIIGKGVSENLGLSAAWTTTTYIISRSIFVFRSIRLWIFVGEIDFKLLLLKFKSQIPYCVRSKLTRLFIFECDSISVFRIIKLSGTVNKYGYEEMICKGVHQKKKPGMDLRTN